MKHLRSSRVLLIALIIAFSGLSSGCGVYFNTFFNAKKAFNSAEKARRNTGRGTQTDYKTAIDKCLKIIENNPSSKYYDDALYILAVSYFYTGQFTKSERRFREILANYPDSKFSRESNMYLAKSRLELGEINEAMAQFTEIFGADEYKRSEKAEAALALGTYYTSEKKYQDALGYFVSVRDSLGDEPQRKIAQIQIADNEFEQFRFADALAAYRKILEMKPTRDEEYHALFNAALCNYRLQKVDEGIADLNKLMKDPLRFDSLETLQMAVAEGQEQQEELVLAEATYNKIASSTKNKVRECQAYYRLGLMYQYNYDNLLEARTYYDKAAKASPGSDEGKDALQRSSDITKVSQFSALIKQDTTLHKLDSIVTKTDTTKIDSTMTDSTKIDSTGALVVDSTVARKDSTLKTAQMTIDKIANTQLDLAELYWFQLNKRDSAMDELRYLIDSFPTAQNAPRAMISLAGMVREEEEDTLKSDSILREVLIRYPKSDYVGEVIQQLGLQGTEADTGYAFVYYRKAEDFLIDSNNIDSARFYYQKVVDNYPDSKYNLQARFNLLWVNDQYASPGDSTLVYAYQEFLDSFPNAPQALEVRNRLAAGSAGARKHPDSVANEVLALVDTSGPKSETQRRDSIAGDTGNTYRDPLEGLYIGPEGDTIAFLENQPITTDEPFEFPAEAISLPDNDFVLYFQVLLDFSGKVVNHILKVRSINDEINRRAERTVASMTFDMLKIRPEYYNKWMVYKMTIRKPDYLK